MSGAYRILFVGRSTAHFSYYESIIAALMERGAAVELALDQAWSARGVAAGQAALEEFKTKHPKLKTSWIARRSDVWRDRLFMARELRTYRSYLTRAETTPFYVDRWRGYLSPNWRARVANGVVDALLRSSFGEIALRGFELAAPADAGIVDALAAKRPHALIASPANMRFSEETDYLKAAKALGIPTFVPVLSWDNLSTKGLLHIVPDRVFVWNEFQKEDALNIQKLPPAVVHVAGAPFFDKWFSDANDLPDRAEFCQRLGFDPARKILLYLGSSKNIAKDESWFVEKLSEALRASPDADVQTAQILVRPHPANADVYRKLTSQGYVVWPADGALPETKQDFENMRASFMHADAAVGINTSGMIDSVLANAPTFSVRIPEYANTQSNSKHFRHLEHADAMYLEQDLASFAASLSRVLAGDDKKEERRRAFAQLFARPQGIGRSAGDVIAADVLAFAAGAA